VVRRTTLSAEADDLAVLAGEARRRGVSLAHVLREAVAEKAEVVRRRRRPRYPLFHGGEGPGIAELMENDPDAPLRTPYRGE
jgi:hypothetical protein